MVPDRALPTFAWCCERIAEQLGLTRARVRASRPARPLRVHPIYLSIYLSIYISISIYI